MISVLAVDTSGPSLSVALLRGGATVYACLRQNGATHSTGVMCFVDEALEAGGIKPAEVDCFAAVAGPGSFTGVRIGVATVRALSHATGRPCFGVNALEALAGNALFFDGIVCPLQDARAGQVYCAGFAGGGRALEDAAMPLTAFLERLAGQARCCFVGDGAAVHREAIRAAMGERAVFPPPALTAIRAENAAVIALDHMSEWHGWQKLAPYYLRAPQAERERLAREAAHG